MKAEDWISVKDEKPKRKKRVLLFVQDDYFPKQIGFLLKSGKYYIEKWKAERDDVIYWMPLPPNPKGIKGYSKGDCISELNIK